MNREESQKFNEILSKGYQNLLDVKPSDPLKHFLYTLTENLSSETLKKEPELVEFRKQYETVSEQN